MNYLAHIFLSGSDYQLQLGNFIGDFVKGKDYSRYPEKIRDGILLHRQIDSFTDSHPLHLQTVNLLRPFFGRYSGIITDMYSDYFLASQFQKFSPDVTLNKFSYRFYASAIVNYSYLPQRVKNFIFHFIATNRLGQYASIDGLNKSLQIMSEYKTSAIQAAPAIEFLLVNELLLRQNFNSFMPEVIRFVNSYHIEHKNKLR